jgi:SAM-dependent methyltransferase
MSTAPVSSKSFDASSYWRRRLATGARLSATGTRPFGEPYQRYLYRLKVAAIRRLLKPFRHRLQGARVLNVGCGWGFFEPVFAAMGARHVVGVDFVPETIRELQARRPEFEYHCASVTEPWPEALAGRSFDLVTSIDVLYHVIDDLEFARAIENLCVLCRGDGGLMLWTEAPLRENTSEHPHCRYRSFLDYQPMFTRYGVHPRATLPVYQLYDAYWPWSERAADHPRFSYPLMYAFDRCFARFGRRVDTNYAALAVRHA